MRTLLPAPSMPDPRRPAAEEQSLAEFPAGLRALLDRELAAGNTIEWIRAGSHPAPPIGACVMLARPRTTSEPLPEGVRSYTRSSSLYSDEITEGVGHFYVLTPPGAPPDMPSMDAIRATHAPPEWTPPVAPTPPADEHIVLDIRGETIVYHAGGRHTYVRWTYTNGHRLVRSSLTHWQGAGPGQSVAMSPEEGDRVFARVLALAPRLVGTANIIVEP
ncbi:MAG: hypothetical protein IT360_08455 [Gemmatimonadaceae bacterium]|nr:hypothetical protein [Gemmatimonadaceae bacterium]